MRAPYQILMPLLSLFFVRVDLTDLHPLRYKIRSMQLLDADTVKVSLGRGEINVRLLKIDAPEMGQPFLNGRGDAGLEATKCAEKLVPKGEAFLTIYGYDIYRRVLGEIENLSFRMVLHGCVTLYPYTRFDSRAEKTKFLRALNLARAKRRGLWAKGGYLRPQLWRKNFKRRGVLRPLHQSARFRKPYRLDQKFARKED